MALARRKHKFTSLERDANAGGSHDDITYQSIANAFGLPLLEHKETYERMKTMGKTPFDWDRDTPAREAKMRMVRMPTDVNRPLEKQFIFTKDDLWVPVNVVNGNVHILPGIPRLCRLPVPQPSTNSAYRVCSRGHAGRDHAYH